MATVRVTGALAGADRGLNRLVWGRAVSAVGDGLWFTIWALYFTRVLDLSTATVGLGMAAAGGAGLIASVPLGAVADRRSPRNVLVAITAVRAVAMAGYLVVHDAWGFLVVTVFFVALANGATAVRTAFVSSLVLDTAARVRALAQQRVAQHVGYAVGAGLGAVVLAADDGVVYRFAIGANAASFLALAALTATLGPGLPRHGSSDQSAWRVLRDRDYCGVVAVTALLSLCWPMLSTGLPLWIAGFTRLPLLLSGAVVVISSIGIAALQVPTTRFTRTTPEAARTATWAALALATSCLLLAGTVDGAGLVAFTAMTLAALLHVAGELGYVAAGWTLSVTLMREESRGAYQGAAEAATAMVQIFGPGFFTLALGTLGAAGWLLAGGLFLAAGLVIPAATGRAIRSRTNQTTNQPLAGTTGELV